MSASNGTRSNATSPSQTCQVVDLQERCPTQTTGDVEFPARPTFPRRGFAPKALTVTRFESLPRGASRRMFARPPPDSLGGASHEKRLPSHGRSLSGMSRRKRPRLYRHPCTSTKSSRPALDARLGQEKADSLPRQGVATLAHCRFENRRPWAAIFMGRPWIHRRRDPALPRAVRAIHAQAAGLGLSSASRPGAVPRRLPFLLSATPAPSCPAIRGCACPSHRRSRLASSRVRHPRPRFRGTCAHCPRAASRSPATLQ
jgi:hypothetical protein